MVGTRGDVDEVRYGCTVRQSTEDNEVSTEDEVSTDDDEISTEEEVSRFVRQTHDCCRSTIGRTAVRLRTEEMRLKKVAIAVGIETSASTASPPCWPCPCPCCPSVSLSAAS